MYYNIYFYTEILAIGLEPISPGRTDFKSVVSTNSTKRAIIIVNNKKNKFSITLPVPMGLKM